jgi:Pentapeptide repeats (8 copies)
MPAPIVAYWEALPAWITFGLVVLAALLLAIAIWWLWWRLPKHQVAWLSLTIRDPKARADAEDNFRKTVGQVFGVVVVLLGTVVALLGAYVAYLQFSQQQRASHDLLISNQVSKGFEQLGSNVLVVRLGGIYALEGVMNGSDQYHQPVLEALTAFVREGAKPPTPEQLASPTEQLPTDIQAALTVIGRRSAGQGVIDLGKANIAGAVLTNALLIDANLSGANLTGAVLIDANLTNALLIDANLPNAFLNGAILTGANLYGAVLPNAFLNGAILIGANLYGANLAGANLTGALIVQSQLDEACGSDAKLPPGLTLEPCPSKSQP